MMEAASDEACLPAMRDLCLQLLANVTRVQVNERLFCVRVHACLCACVCVCCVGECVLLVLCLLFWCVEKRNAPVVRTITSSKLVFCELRVVNRSRMMLQVLPALLASKQVCVCVCSRVLVRLVRSSF